MTNPQQTRQRKDFCLGRLSLSHDEQSPQFKQNYAIRRQSTGPLSRHKLWGNTV